MMVQSVVGFETSAAHDGYVCPACGIWVNPSNYHICPNSTASIPSPPLVIPIPTLPSYWLDPRVEALIHRVDELEKKLKLRGEKDGN